MPAEKGRLTKYRQKRRFDRTPEPSGGAAGDEPIFVVQKHAARRLHYDLRLQVGDTLRSWAVPEGPSLDTKVRRFAKQVEDHPLDYATFEGRIPEGEYGGGTVIVWDRGTWTSPSDVAAALEKGELKFRLAGEKLTGGWMLKRLPDDPTNWLLIKERDPSARPMADYDVLKELPDSVITGASVASIAPLAAARNLAPPRVGRIQGRVAKPFPKAWSPQLAGTAETVPAGAGWLHEIKYDGYRTICLFNDGKVRLLTRNGHDWTDRYAPVAKAFGRLPCKSAVIDGEIVVQDPRGVTKIGLLEDALSAGQSHLFVFFAFDLCYLDGHDLSAVPLIERKAALEKLVDPLIEPRSPVQLSQHVEGDGAALFARACEMGLEGIISKKTDSPYVQGRSTAWLKIKRSEVSEFAIIGFIANTPRMVTSLILADGVGDQLSYAGRAGSGFSEEIGRDLYRSLAPDEIKTPVVALPERSGRWSGANALDGARWVKPGFTATIGHRGRTDTNAIRHAVLLKFVRRKPAAPRKALKTRLVTDSDLAGIRLTNPDREMFKGSGVTKLDIALYYARVGDWMLPHLLRRPVTILRCPTGAKDDCFYQRHAFTGLPDGVEPVDLSDEEGRGAFLTITEPKGYLALAQFGAVELHPWGCHIDNPDAPDRMVIDLDPAPDVSWSDTKAAAEILRTRLEALGFQPFVRTTGGKGLHLVAALAKGGTWKTLKGFSQGFARSAAVSAPNLFTSVAAKAKRPGRIFIDYLRNARGATAVASYSLRARDGFPVATPITWDELQNLNAGDAFTISNMQNRLSSLAKDPWSELGSNPIKITPRMEREVGMS